MGQLSTTPAVLYLGTTEDVTYAWNPANYNAGDGDSAISDPFTVVTDLTDQGEVVDLPDTPNVVGGLVYQRLRGTTFTAGHTYQVLVSYTGSPSGNVLTMETQLQVPF